MDNLKIVGAPLPDMPWEDRPEGSKEVLWRYSKNPVIPRDILPTSNSVFNSAVVPFKGGYAGVFRCDDTNRRMRLHVGFSADAIHWSISETKLEFECDDKEIGEFVYAYDPRVCFIEDRYYVTWCNGYHGPTIGVAYTFDFETFHQLENAYLPFNRNGVMFPRKINGNFAMLSRPSDNGHTPFGDIFYSESPDMCFWGKHRHVMSPAAFEDSAQLLPEDRRSHPDGAFRHHRRHLLCAVRHDLFRGCAQRRGEPGGLHKIPQSDHRGRHPGLRAGLQQRGRHHGAAWRILQLYVVRPCHRGHCGHSAQCHSAGQRL